MELELAKVIFREDLYPRIKRDPALVQKYAENIDFLPPIEVNERNELIDGWHRWTAHKKAERPTISVVITSTKSDLELFKFAIKRNASHGSQLDEDSKQKLAVRLYGAGTGESKEEIASTLSVSLRQVNNYLTDIDRKLREERKEKIFSLFMACHTQPKIAEAVGVSQQTVSDEMSSITDFGNISKTGKSLANFMDAEFEIPLYNVWAFGKKTNKTEIHGNSEQRILENLLYLYTEPFDIVIDPFAGGGSTIDVCLKRLRRYYVCDRKPIPERAEEIRQRDIAEGPPELSKRWAEVSLTYLDPPYWKQAEGKYSSDQEDLANMELDRFTTILASYVKAVAKKQSKGVIALLIQPTQWNSPGKRFTDHIIDLINAIENKKLILLNRVSCPYQTQQYNPQQVEYAKEKKLLLVLTRELIIWGVNA